MPYRRQPIAVRRVRVPLRVHEWRRGPVRELVLPNAIVIVWSRKLVGELPSGPEYSAALELAEELGSPTGRRPLQLTWASHGNTGDGRAWVRTGELPELGAPWRSYRSIFEISTAGDASFEAPGPSELDMADDELLIPPRFCHDTTCVTTLRVPQEHAYWAYQMALHGTELETREFFRRISGSGLGTSDLLTSEEVAALLGISTKTLRNWRSDPGSNVPAPVRRHGRTLLFNRGEIERWQEVRGG